MEVNPDNCGQPTVSDIPGALPLLIRPPSPSASLCWRCNVSCGMPKCLSALFSGALPAPGSSVWIPQDGREPRLALGRQITSRRDGRAKGRLRLCNYLTFFPALLTLTLLKTKKSVWRKKKSPSQVLRVSNKPPTKQAGFFCISHLNLEFKIWELTRAVWLRQ